MQIEITISSAALGIVPYKRVSRESRDPQACLKCGFNETRTDWSMIAVDPGDHSNSCERIAPFHLANEDKRRFLASYNNFQLPRINGGPYILRCRTGAAGGTLANARLFARTVFLGRAEIYHPWVTNDGNYTRAVWKVCLYYDGINTVHETYNIDAIMRGCDSWTETHGGQYVSNVFERQKNLDRKEPKREYLYCTKYLNLLISLDMCI